MNVFFSADLHLGHTSIIRHCDRPFFLRDSANNILYDEFNKPLINIEEHDQAVIDSHNKVVGKKDMLYILGDFAWKNHGSYLARLNGKKILILGNHDKMPQAMLRNFTEVHHILVKNFGKNNTDIFVMCHYPMLSWPHSCYGSTMLHGHCHGRTKELDTVRRMDVGVDVGGPFHIDFIRYKMNLKQKLVHSDSGFDANEVMKTNKENNIKLLEEYAKSKFQSI